ncbi:MAG: hypothetical protein DRN15_08575 [Thermoprotei archaeon]|nr:MAG: hypothetical protein DRN15_08575 [Thermoprotei archaeon]
MKGVLDTSILIEVYDRGKEKLLADILDRYNVLYVPWIVLYEYLYGHKYMGRSVQERKVAVEKLGNIVGATQEIILQALELDVALHKQGLTLPFSDLLVASTAIVLGAELITLDKEHYERIPRLRIYVPENDDGLSCD